MTGDYPDAKHRLLSAEEERGLAARIRSADFSRLLPHEKPSPQQQAALDARNELVWCNQRLVFCLARSFLGLGVPYGDLIQEGNLALISAANNYNPEKYGVRFSTFATYRVRRVLVELWDRRALIRLPNWQHWLLRKYGEKIDATELENAGSLGLPPKRLKCLKQGKRIKDRQSMQGEEEIWGQAAPEHEEPEADEQAIKAALGKLSARERKLIAARFGLDDGRPKTLTEVGKVIGGITRERVRQIELKAMGKLRKALTA